jgi:4-aminobutyrate aminotransferase-like enzyme
MNFSKNISKAIKILHPTIYPKYASGSWLYTRDNEKYLDFTSGIGALSTGHNHPYIIKNVKNQLDKYVHMPQQLFNIHEASNELTGKLLDIMPDDSLDSFFYVNSGSEATDNAIKMARSYTKKQNIITMNKGFHGRTYGALSVTTSNLSCKQNINPMVPGVYYSDINNIDSFEQILKYQTSPEDVACVIYEPVQGEGGIYSLDKDFLKDIHDICSKYNIITIADEVQCGFGRTGTYWNIEQKCVVPDIMTFGKGIASGFPLAGLVANEKIMNNIGQNFLGGTYGGNAVSCAAASATIDIFKTENILTNVMLKGEMLKKGLLDIPGVKSIRQHGLMIGIELFDGNEPHYIKQIVEKMKDNNILILTCGNNSQYIRLLPPLNINNEDCNLFLTNFRKVFKNTF